MHALGFEMLEIGERVNAEQSSGRIVHVPNSYIFTKTLKNYTKVFKYIWNEMKLDIELDSDIEKTKEIIYDILHNNEVLKEIPKKTEDAVEEEIFEYRVFDQAAVQAAIDKVMAETYVLQDKEGYQGRQYKSQENS